MDKNLALTVAGLFFGIVAMFHLFRLFNTFEITFAGRAIPVWASIIGLVIAGALCIWMFMAARR